MWCTLWENKKQSGSPQKPPKLARYKFNISPWTWMELLQLVLKLCSNLQPSTFTLVDSQWVIKKAKEKITCQKSNQRQREASAGKLNIHETLVKLQIVFGCGLGLGCCQWLQCNWNENVENFWLAIGNGTGLSRGTTWDLNYGERLVLGQAACQCWFQSIFME